MRVRTNNKILLVVLTAILTCLNAKAISLWVGQTHTWDFSGSVIGSTYNMSVSSNGGYLSITGSGFYRNITPTQYFSGTATITAEWDYTLYYGDTKKHKKVTLTVSCNENPVSIYPTSVTLSPGETYQLSYSHAYDNQYVGAANAYFSGGNSSFSVTSSGLITAKSPGTGYVNVYSKVSNAANAPHCFVTVKEVAPTGASTNSFNILADQGKDLSVTVSPSNATVKSKQWYVKNGSDVVSISGQRLTALNPGTATIYCMVNGAIRSNDATVTVSEPQLTNTSSTPANEATDISVFANPSASYSHAISKGDSFNSVTLTTNGTKVNGTVEISGSTVRFLPAKPLAPQTNYKLFIPRNAVKNKWGSPAQKDVTLSFKTGPLEKATVSMTPVSGSYLTKSDAVTLSSYPSNATIYYTTDGTNPTMASKVYTNPIKEDGDFMVKAFAACEGYETSEITSGQYYKSESEILEYYPNDVNPLFNYALATPYLKLSGAVEKSNNFRRITLKDKSGNAVSGETFITNYLVIFIPKEPLENCNQYTMDIPRDALKTKNGEIFKGFTWTFTTPTMPSAIAMEGDESVFVLSEDGTLKSRGMFYQSITPENGSFTWKEYDRLTELLWGIKDVSGGYSHILKLDHQTVTGSGKAFCGETGTSSSIASIGEIKIIKAGFQTSAIIDNDNSLWMCGRNDFYQLGDNTGTTSKAFVKVADNVMDVALGNGFTLYIDTDNVLWGVGRNHLGQLGDGTRQNRRKPVKIMDNVSKAYASISGYFSACITTDGNLLTWGDNSSSQLGWEADKYSSTPGFALKNVVSASLGGSHVLAVNDKYELYSWGSNTHGQIAKTGTKVNKPSLMAENVMSVCAGPNTSLILGNSGKVTGWGCKTHNNFGTGEGNASGFTVFEGNTLSTLNRVSIEPYIFEAEPSSRFALVAVPNPLSSDYDTVEWSSSNPSVAEIDNNGIVNTGNIGNAKITVKFTNRFGVSKTGNATIICTNNPDNSGIEGITDNSTDWFTHTDSNTIFVERAVVGAVYTVYSIEGFVVGKTKADNDLISFSVNQPGIYIVQSGTKVVKVICK